MLYFAGVPEVKIYSSTLTTQEGGNLTFTCQVTGVPTPVIRWKTDQLRSNWTLQVHHTGFMCFVYPWQDVILKL